jgi:hypothetical protein
MTFGRTRWAAIAVMLAGLATSPIARADAWDAAMAQGAAARDRANDTGDPAEWDVALRAFEDADRLKSTADSKFELANAAAHLQADALAYDAYEGAIALGLSGKAKEVATTFIAAHEKDIARLNVLGPDGTVVQIQGHRRGVLPLTKPIIVFRGKSNVSLQLPDGTVVEREITTDGSAPAVIDLRVTTKPEVIDQPPPPPPTTVKPSHRTEWIIIGTGGGLMVTGLVGYLVSTSALESKRSALPDSCAVLDGSDACSNPKLGRSADAQSTVDGIATWKSMRVVSAIGAGVGLGVAAFGLVQLASSLGAEKQAGFVPMVTPVVGGAHVGVHFAF